MKLIIINGPSGIGKSTVATRLCHHIPSSFLVDVDELRREMPDYRERRAESLSFAYERTREIIDEELNRGHDVIIDKTISSAGVLDSFIERGKRHGAEIFEILLFAEKEVVHKRADDRGYRLGGLLTSEKVDELWEKMNALRKQRSEAIVIDTANIHSEELFQKIKAIIA